MSQCQDGCKLDEMQAEPLRMLVGKLEEIDAPEIRAAAIQDLAEMILNAILAWFELPDLRDANAIEDYLDNIAQFLRQIGIVGKVPDILGLREIGDLIAAAVNCYEAVLGELSGGRAKTVATPALLKMLLPFLVNLLIKRLEEYVKLREFGDDSAAVREAMRCQS